MKRAALILAALCLATPASAHRLKLFATLDGDVISGYAFFVGSGRAQGAEISVKDSAGKEVSTLTTDAQGAYSYKAATPQAYHLTANTGDGHVADATIDAARFGATSGTTLDDDAADTDGPAAPALTQAQIERAVDAAVARQIRPLLEAYDAAEGRTRFNDIVGGVGMIVGLAGLALWGDGATQGSKIMSLVRAGDEPVFAIEQLDPRARILSACAIVLSAVAMQSFAGQIAMLFAALGLAACAELKPRDMLHRLLHVEGFMAVLLVLLPLTMPGRAIATLGPLALSEAGLMRALAIVLKVNAAVLATMALLATLEPVRLGRGLASLGAPSRLVHILLFVVRYQSLFREEGARLMEAMRARGFAPKLDMRTWRAYGAFTGMLLVRSMERAERVEEAMRCRGFSGKFPLRATRPLQRADYAFMAAVAIFAAALVVWDRLI